MVLAQEEARLLNHNYIGTEHLLLGLIHESEGVAARALESLGISLDFVRGQVEELIGQGASAPSGHMPFTPRAKKVLELALREAIQLGHNYIGSEHILLGLLREGKGVAAEVLTKAGVSLQSVRERVLTLLSGTHAPVQASLPSHTPAGARINSVARALASGRPVGSDHYPLALVADEQSLAARVLSSVGVDRESLEQRLAELDRSGTSDELVEDAGARQTTLRVSGEAIEVRVEDPSLATALREALEKRDPSRETLEQAIGGADPAASTFPALWKAVTQTARDVAAHLAGDPGSIAAEVHSSLLRRLRARALGDVPTQSDESGP